MAKFKGLGRGLEALLGSGDTSTPERLETLAVQHIRPGKYQPRTHMDEAALEELAASIRNQGVIQPVVVRPLVDGDYELIAGERRWRAAQRAGLEQIPAVIREVRDEAALAMALIENIQREELNALEEAQGIQRLIDEFGMTHDVAAQAIGRSRSAVSNLLRLLDLPDAVKQLLQTGQIDMGHARALLPLDGARAVALAQEATLRGLSVRDVEERVRKLLEGAPPKPEKKLDPDIARLQEDLSDRIGAEVVIRAGSKGRGQVTIHYTSLDHLDSLLARIQ